MKILHLLSGGLDSTVLLYDLLHQKHTVRCVLFNYGQKHLAELRYARATCANLKVEYDEVELARIKNLFLRCRLTDGKGGDIAKGRNGVFLSIAAAMAAGLGFDAVTITATKDDEANFPDCRPLYLHAVNTSFNLGEIGVEILFPYVDKTKRDIVEIGRRLNVPFEETMSCYEGTNCDNCDACIKRRKALCGL